MADTQGAATTSRKPLRWAGFLAAGVLGALLGNTAFAVARADRGGMPGSGGHGFFKAHGGDPERARAHALSAIDLAFRVAGANDEQRAQAKGIVSRHLEGVVALHARHRANHKAGLEALSGSTVDREKIEAVRVAQVQLADDASRTIAGAVTELAEVLTPEQRTELLALATRFHH